MVGDTVALATVLPIHWISLFDDCFTSLRAEQGSVRHDLRSSWLSCQLAHNTHGRRHVLLIAKGNIVVLLTSYLRSRMGARWQQPSGDTPKLKIPTVWRTGDACVQTSNATCIKCNQIPDTPTETPTAWSMPAATLQDRTICLRDHKASLR